MVTERARQQTPVDESETAKRDTAAVRLKLRHPEFDGKVHGDLTRADAWRLLSEAYADVNRGVQQGMGDALLVIRRLRVEGKNRWMTGPERSVHKETGIVPGGCYSPADIGEFSRVINGAVRATGLSEYVYSSVAQRLASSEFSGAKLVSLLRGDIAFPVPRNVGLMMRNRNWTLSLEQVTRTVRDTATGQDVERTYTRPTIRLTSLRPKGGAVTLVCEDLGARAKHHLLPVLEGIASGEHEQGTLTLRKIQRPGQMAEWQILLAYKSEKVSRGLGAGIVAAHRGIVNLMTCAYVNDDGAGTIDYGARYKMPGDDVIGAKAQFLARKSRALQGICGSKGPRRRGGRHYRYLERIGDAENRWMDTAIWKIAKFVETVARERNARLVIVEDFGNWLSDAADEQGRYLQPYLRRFPFFKLKARILDVCKRRLGIEIVEVPGRYISQKCPLCGHAAEENIVAKPRFRSPREGGPQDGRFQCARCGFRLGLDEVASTNMLFSSGQLTEAQQQGARDWLARHHKIAEDVRLEMREARDVKIDTGDGDELPSAQPPKGPPKKRTGRKGGAKK